MDDSLLQQAREALAAHEAVIAEHAEKANRLRAAIAILEGKGNPPAIRLLGPFQPFPVPQWPPFGWGLDITCQGRLPTIAETIFVGDLIGGSGYVRAFDGTTLQITSAPLEHLDLS